eukprot:scaffold90296_cov68-Phaeocystis_antarctica.AAC.9
MWATLVRVTVRHLDPRRRPGPRRSAAARDPQSGQHRHRRRGAGGPRAGPAAAARARISSSCLQPVRRQGPRRPRGATVAGCAALACA